MDIEAAAALWAPAIFSRIRSIACTGSSPFGQTSAQFMMVLQRNSRYGIVVEIVEPLFWSRGRGCRR